MKPFSFLFLLIAFSLQACGQGKARLPMANANIAPKQPPKAEIKKVQYECNAPCFDFSKPITVAEQAAISRKIDSLCNDSKQQAKYVSARHKDFDAAQATSKKKPTARSATTNKEAVKFNP